MGNINWFKKDTCWRSLLRAHIELYSSRIEFNK